MNRNFFVPNKNNALAKEPYLLRQRVTQMISVYFSF